MNNNGEKSVDLEPIVDIKGFGMEKSPKLKGRGPILRIENLSFYPGRVYAVIGESGSGKSVLNSLLMGFPAYSNKSEKVKNLKLPQIRFYLPQLLPDGRGYEMKTEEYIREAVYALLASGGMRCERRTDYIGEAKKKYFEKLEGKLKADGVDLKALEAKLENDKKVLTKPLRALSGGQRRRVELEARILAVKILIENSCGRNESALLILDEPTTGFDWQNQAEFLNRVSEVGHATETNMAVVIVTHALNRLIGGDKKIFDEVVCVKKSVVKVGNKDVECCKVSRSVDVQDLYEKIKEDIGGDDIPKEENAGNIWQKLFEWDDDKITKILNELQESNGMGTTYNSKGEGGARI